MEEYVIIFDRSSLFLISMYLGIAEDVSRAKTHNSLKCHRAAPRLSAQMYLGLSKSGLIVDLAATTARRAELAVRTNGVRVLQTQLSHREGHATIHVGL